MTQGVRDTAQRVGRHATGARHVCPATAIILACVGLITFMGCATARQIARTDRRPLPVCDAAVREAPRDSVVDILNEPSARSRYLAAARPVPGGFAGMERDAASGELVMLLTDTSRASEARAYLRSMRETGDSTLSRGLSDSALTRLRVLPARWSYSQLHDWFIHLTRLTLGSVVAAGATTRGIGISSGNRITIVVGDDTSRAIAERVLAAHAIPCGLVVTELGGLWVP